MLTDEADWRPAVACRSADPELFFPISIVRSGPGADSGGKSHLRGVPGPARMPAVRAEDMPETRGLGRHERTGAPSGREGQCIKD